MFTADPGMLHAFFLYYHGIPSGNRKRGPVHGEPGASVVTIDSVELLLIHNDAV